MMRKTLIVGLMTGSLLGGCTMIPDFDAPAPPVAAQWPGAAAEATGNPEANEKPTPVAAIAWESFFQSKPMQDVIRASLEHNKDLRIAVLNVEAARAIYRIERADLLPNVTGGATGTRQRSAQALSGIPGAGGVTEIYTAQVNASYEIDIFGRIRSLSRFALEQYFASEETQRAVQVSLIAETANAYLQLQADREILKLTEDTLKAQEKSYELINERFKRGVSSKLELSQAQIPVEMARVNHALYTRLVEQDKNALIQLIGEPPADTLLAEEKLDSFKLLENLPVGLPSEVLLLRPDVRAAEHRLLAANADIGAARAAFFPTISLTGAFGEASTDLSDLFTSGATKVWSFAPSVNVPIFQGGRNFANLALTNTNRDIAVAEYEQAIQAAFREVADELAARATLNAQLEATNNLVQASQTAYDVSNARYKQGIDNFLTVLDAQRSLFDAQQSAIEVRKQRLANLVNLYKALGGGQLSEADSNQD